VKPACAAAIVACVLAAGLASCGGGAEDDGSGGGDREQILEVARDYAIAARSGDGRAACDLMTETGREEAAKTASTSCERSFALPRGTDPPADAHDSKVELIALTGNLANVAVSAGRVSGAVFLQKDAEGWKVVAGSFGSGG
jgi:hypothetical protein